MHPVVVRRAGAVKEARNDLLKFVKLLHPTAENPDDPLESQYVAARHHRLVADQLQKLERGKLRRLILVLPPRHGKTELATKAFVPWYMGKHPTNSVIVASYSDTFANDLGRAIRNNIEHQAFRQVFPMFQLDPEARSVARMETLTNKGRSRGAISIVGRGSAVTGRGGDLLLVDDPIKDRKEADSPTIRDNLWDWFNQVFMTRLMTDKGVVCLIQTRWHSDDLVGRLTDPRNPCYSEQEARNWKVVHIKALAGENDPAGRREGAALWPQRFGLKYLRRIQRQDPRGFSALYQGEPNPAEGAFFEEHTLRTYVPREMPPEDKLRWYMASDHAVSTKQGADRTCIMLIGLDKWGTIWVHPQLTWQRMPSDQAVKAALWLVEHYKPMFWFAERGAITKSIGPFLRQQMMEQQVFVSIREFTPIQDKQARAQSIAARMSVGAVRFPAQAAWWADAKHELLSFPHGRFDDFVDTLALIGLGLGALTPAEKDGRGDAGRFGNQPIPKFGTLGWVKDQARRDATRRGTSRSQGW